MLQIVNGKDIHIHRGDEATLIYKIPITISGDGTVTEWYQFKENDVIRLSIFEKGSDYQTPISEIVVILEEDTYSVEIPINSENTCIGDSSSKPVDYYYEISLNGTNTTTGYSVDNKDCIFKILPAKGSDN